MLKELWEKLHGAKDWVDVDATVRTIEYYDEPPSRAYHLTRKLADVTFAYTYPEGELQYGWITVDESSPLYDAKENDTLSIRVNPAQPDQYLSDQAAKTSL